MPVIKSSQKRVRQTLKATARNRQLKKQIRLANQQLQVALVAKKTKPIQAARSQYDSLIDKAVKKKLIHRNKAARHKARAARLCRASQPTTKPKPASKAKN